MTDRPSKKERLETAAEEAAEESLLEKTKKKLETKTEKKNKRLKELEAELGLNGFINKQEGGMVNKYNHGGSVKGNARMQGVKKIQTQGFKFNHKIN